MLRALPILLCAIVPAHAQTQVQALGQADAPPPVAVPPATPAPGAKPDVKDAPGLFSQEAVEERNRRLEAVRADLENARERREALAREIAALGDDRAAITKALIAVAGRRQEVEEAVTATEARLADLEQRRAAIRRGVDRRRDVLVEVLAALQRMGGEPPPALVVAPEDAVGSVRSAILLGSVVPQLRAETAALRADLTAFEAVRGAIVDERKVQAAQAEAIAADEMRLAALAAEKRRSIEGSQAALEREQARAAALADRAESLSGLIRSLETEIHAARRAAAKARAATERRRARELARLEAARRDVKAAMRENGPLRAGIFADTGRLEPAVAFDRAKGLLPRPVAGAPSRRFGDPTPDGRARNVAFRARPGAPVRAPADGWVLYAGPFRSYGHLLIVDAGDGYHVVLMGLGSVHVGVGRFVLAGEPVGRMAEAPGTADGTAIDVSAAKRPTLTVEFRRDGRPIDPAPWWAGRDVAGR